MSGTKPASATHSPWLSVIVPIYNAQKHINKAITSILTQSFTDYELLLIDDGSTDISSEICLNYAQNDSRIRYIRIENGGSFHARLHGIKFALGKYVTFCDSDDYYATKDAFASIYEIISTHNCQLLQFGFIRKFNHLSKSSKNKYSDILVSGSDFNKNEYPGILCNGYTSSHLTTTVWNKVYSIDLFNSLLAEPKFERIFWGDDLIVNLYALKDCHSAFFTCVPLYVYSYGGGTTTFSMRTMNDLDTIKHYQLMFLNERTEDDIELIRNHLFSETAAWLYIHVCEGINSIDEKSMEDMIFKILSLPNFKLAREHFLNNTENWTAVNLLRNANPKEYIASAREANTNISVKQKITFFLKDLYTKI